MKKLLVFISLIISFNCKAQEIALELFMCDTALVAIEDIAFCPNGDYFIIGGDRNLSPNWIQRGILKKYSSNHQLLWTKYYGGSKGDGFANIHWLAPDRLLLSGFASSIDGDLAAYGKGPTAGDIWLVVVDTNGNILHGNSWGYGNYTGLRDLKIIEDGHIFAYCSAGANYGDFAANNLGLNWVPALIYTDTQLNKKWVKVFNNGVSGSASAGFKISIINDKVLTCASVIDDSFGIWKPSVDTGDYENTFLLLTDTNQQTTKFVYGGKERQMIGHTLPHTDSTAYILGDAIGNGGISVADTILPGIQFGLIVLSKVNLNTGELFGWKHIFGAFGGKLSNNGNLIFSAMHIKDSLLWLVYSIKGSDTGGYLGQGIGANREIFIVALSINSGKIVTKKRFSSGCEFDKVISLKTNAAGDIFLASAVRCASGQNWTPPGICYTPIAQQGVGVVYKLSMWPTSVQTNTKLKEQWQLYPNPAKGSFYITHTANAKNATLLVQDVAGKTLIKKQFQGNSYTCSIDGLASGHYVVTLQVAGNSSSKKLMVE
jgi:hypothetical protein